MGKSKAVDEFTRRKGINDRSKDRLLDKKQGGQGKGRREAANTLAPVQVFGKGDPLYSELDSDDFFDNESPTSVMGARYVTRRRFQSCKHSLPEFKEAVELIVEEYFSSEECEEVGRSLAELASPFFHYEFVKRAITMSMDRTEKERELVSKLLSDLSTRNKTASKHFPLLSKNQMGKGFEQLFEVEDDLELDVPLAAEHITHFLVRAVGDELLPRAFLSDPLVQGMGGKVVIDAIKLIRIYQNTSRAERVWGPGRSVPELKAATDQLLQEYLLSKDSGEAIRCILELNVPYFHHEVVKRAVTNCMDKGPAVRATMYGLLYKLRQEQVVSVDQMMKGFDRLGKNLPDLVLDAPNAARLVEEFVVQGMADGVLPKDYKGLLWLRTELYKDSEWRKHAQAEADLIFKHAQRLSLCEEVALRRVLPQMVQEAPPAQLHPNDDWRVLPPQFGI
jgi:programmed cell death protein 4